MCIEDDEFPTTEPSLEDYCTPSEEDQLIQVRVTRFNDLVTSGMAEEDAYALLADERNMSDEVTIPFTGPFTGHHVDIYELRKMRMALRFRVSI